MTEVSAGRRTSKRGAQATWVLAGAPIAVAALQAIATLTGYKMSTWPVVGPLAGYVHSFELFAQASWLFYEKTALVVFLFLLITASWIAVGLTVFPNRVSFGGRGDSVRTGAVSFAAVLYLVLFLGVYLPLWDLDVALTQRVGFFALPFVVSGLLFSTWTLYPDNAPVEDLETARETLETKRRAFESAVRRRIDRGVVSDFETVLDDGETAARARARLNEFEDEVADLESAVGEAERRDSVPTDRATMLRERAENLEPEAVVEEVGERLAGEVVERADAEYNPLALRTPYGDEYDLVNHRSTIYVSSGLGEDGSSEIHLSEIADTLRRGVRTGDLTPKAAMQAVVNVEDAVYGTGGIVETVRDREAEFADAEDATRDELAGIEEDLDDLFDPSVGKMLERIYVDGVLDDVRTTDDVRDHLREGQDLLAECRFDAAMREVRNGRELARDIHEVLDDIWALTGSLEDERSPVGVPSPGQYEYGVFSYEVFEKLRPALKSTYGADYEVEESDDRLTVEYSEPRPTAGGSQSAEPDEAFTDAQAILGEVRSAAASETESSDREVEVQYYGGRIPEFFRSEEALTCLRRFVAERPDLTDAADVAEEDDYISIRAPAGTSIEQCVDDMIDEFENWAETATHTDITTR